MKVLKAQDLQKELCDAWELNFSDGWLSGFVISSRERLTFWASTAWIHPQLLLEHQRRQLERLATLAVANCEYCSLTPTLADLRADHVASLGLETGGTLDKIVYFERRDADMTRASGRARRR
ncbi:hypothetical protein PF010_g25460 [Phytophthora fragariae]|uniref:HTH CENPB-type domain-containing protein n=1 Tax=Phytophthora fragariae TaxID=53985 RepID=A0A6A3E6G1_9STRA|nr:hypothetical protein PF009_g20703 [Phytophthora fragariae]KAE9072493.1 hypothetical protein PF010_g25460 [Phytophthora fragariae]KAE9105395.1 hypothetical protein PF006_g21651 [Phytophthora fragariae]